MKNKIFLVIAISLLLVCTLAISISATTAIPEFTDVIDVSATIDTSSLAKGVQDDNSSRVLLRNEDGSYSTYLTKYITKFNGGYNDDDHFVPYFDALINATGKNYDVTSIISIEIPEGTLRLSNTYSKTSTWTNVMYVKAPSTLVRQASMSFTPCANIKVLDFSKANISNADKEFLTNNSSVEKIIFPAGCTTLGQWSLHSLTALECVYVPATVETTNGLINDRTGSGKFVFFYTGDIKAETQHTALYTSLNKDSIVELKWDATKSDSYYIDLAKTEGKIYIVYGYSVCNAFYDGKHLTAEQTYEFTSFTEKSYVKSICSRCNQGTVLKEIAPLFTCLGYSAPENGKGGIAIGFTVNSEAIAEYKEVTGKTVSYGVFAAIKDRLNGGDVFENGEANECAIVVDMTTYATAAFEIKIIGFETDNQKTAQIAMGAYVKVDNDYSYMQNSAPDENEKYCFDSFNDIVGNSAQ
ncbi:MAG: leucine-rich repeat protein [Clostridia bacterium]|nr:leucine-rich repeat protein [Clostridia bacterium]